MPAYFFPEQGGRPGPFGWVRGPPVGGHDFRSGPLNYVLHPMGTRGPIGCLLVLPADRLRTVNQYGNHTIPN
jgi:hypothetical protein